MTAKYDKCYVSLVQNINCRKKHMISFYVPIQGVKKCIYWLKYPILRITQRFEKWVVI